MDEFSIGVVMAANGIFIALFEMVIVFKLEGKRPYLALMFYGSLLMGSFISAIEYSGPSVGLCIATVFMFVITIAEIIAMPFMNSYYISQDYRYRTGDNMQECIQWPGVRRRL